METRASYMAVGAFSLLAVAGALLFVLWAANNTKGEQIPYDIYFRQSVSGLSTGSNVLFNGVRIGQVTAIKISQEDPAAVRVRIEVASDTPIREDSVASLEPQGLTGIAVVSISGGNADRPLMGKAPDGQVAVIPSKPSSLQELMASAPNILASANDVLDSIKDMLNEENADSFGTILISLAEVMSTVASKRDSIESTLESFETASTNFATASKRLDALTANLQRASGRELRDTLKSIERAANRVESAVGAAEPGLSELSGEGITSLRLLVAESRSLVRNLTRLIQHVESDPRRFLFGNPVQEVKP